MTTHDEKFLQARTQLSEGKFQEAFLTFRPILRYPGMVQQGLGLADALTLLADICAGLTDSSFEDIVREAANDPDDANTLYHLGYELIEQGLSDIAATVLAHAHQLYPEEEAILTELCTALEGHMRYAEVCQILQAAPDVVQNSFLCTYLLAFNSFMSGDLATARQLQPTLQQMQAQDERYPIMAARINDMLARTAILTGHTALDTQDLRGWHLAITAGLLLHLSPHGFDEGMNGRYAYVSDSKELCFEGIRKVQAIFDSLKIQVPRIFALPDRDSRILAIATATAFNVPLQDWPQNGSEEPGLIVCYDLNSLDDEILLTLVEHQPGQFLWSHAACWTAEQPFTADFTTLLYQVNHSPWGEQMTVDPDTNNLQTRPADERDPAIIATEILTASLENDNLKDVPILLKLVQELATAKDSGQPIGLFDTAGQRQRQWAGSPVPSNYFH